MPQKRRFADLLGNGVVGDGLADHMALRVRNLDSSNPSSQCLIRHLEGMESEEPSSAIQTLQQGQEEGLCDEDEPLHLRPQWP